MYFTNDFDSTVIPFGKISNAGAWINANIGAVKNENGFDIEQYVQELIDIGGIQNQVNNLAIIVGCSVGAVAVAVITLLVVLKVKKNSKKTVVNASAEQIKQYIM
jgi:hypothetical protein